jgi:short-subunit dehydrogenase
MHVVVTGASSGIGEGVVREYARAGAKLTLVARRRELLEKIDQEIGGGSGIIAHDLSDPLHVADWVPEAIAKHGPIDVLVSNAGMENVGIFAETDPMEGLKLLNLNLVSPLLLTRAVLPAMLERGSGALVHVSSVSAFAPLPGMQWYGASKAGLGQFSESLRLDLSHTPIRVVTVYPGPVKTAMGDAAFEKYGGRKGMQAMTPEGSTEGLARLIRRAVEHNTPRIVYPAAYRVAQMFPTLSRWASSQVAPRPRSLADKK